MSDIAAVLTLHADKAKLGLRDTLKETTTEKLVKFARGMLPMHDASETETAEKLADACSQQAVLMMMLWQELQERRL